MSRSGYSYDLDQWSLIRWRGAVKSAIRGNRGQSFLRQMAEALDAMPEKKLIRSELRDEEGQMCALGVVGSVKGLPIETIDPEDSKQVARFFGIAEALAKEIVFENDEGSCFRGEDDEHRWQRMRRWVADNLVPSK